MEHPLWLRVLKSRLWIGAYVLTAIVAGVVVWVVGHRGIFFYDQSGIFDGAWRILQGQVIYRDFHVPYGPVIFFVLSWFFRVAGVDFSSMVLSAAVVNVLAVLVVMWLVRMLLPDLDQRPTAIAAGLLSAVWFQAPTGTLWFEQIGFLFNLLSLALVLKSASHRNAMFLRVAAGCCLVLSVLSKQTVAVFLPVPIVAAVITCLPNRRKASVACFHILLGMLLLSGVFVAWLVLFSSPTGFWRSVIVMSRALAAERGSLIQNVIDPLRLSNTWRRVWPSLALLVASFAMGGISLGRNAVLIAWIVVSYVFSQNLFVSLTLNEPENEMGFIGLISGLAFGIFFEVFWKKRLSGKHPIAYWLSAPLMVFILYQVFLNPARSGWGSSRTRYVLQFPPDTRFSERLQVRGASRVKWGEPTLVDTVDVTRKDFEDLNAWLDNANSNFFVFTDATILYGLHKRVSPQPWVFLIPQHSFLLSDISEVDETVLNSLQRNNVTAVILEKASFGMAPHELMEKMPKLRSWIDTQFEKAAEFGLFEVWKLRGS